MLWRVCSFDNNEIFKSLLSIARAQALCVWEHVCVHTGVCVQALCVWVRGCEHVCVHTGVCVQALCVWGCVWEHVFVCESVCTRACVCASVHTHSCTGVSACVCVCGSGRSRVRRGRRPWGEPAPLLCHLPGSDLASSFVLLQFGGFWFSAFPYSFWTQLADLPRSLLRFGWDRPALQQGPLGRAALSSVVFTWEWSLSSVLPFLSVGLISKCSVCLLLF